jgi:hypothetical protein
MAGRPQRRLRELQALMNPVEFDTSRAASMKQMKEKWLDIEPEGLGPWLPGNRERLEKTGAKLKPIVRVILPDINNRFTVQQVTPELGVLKILASSESPGPHELKGVNFWHRLFDDAGGSWHLVPEGMSRESVREWIDDNVPNLSRLRLNLTVKRQMEVDKALSSTLYARRRGKNLGLGDFFPVVRSNQPSPRWVTSEDTYADIMASVLGFVRGLKLSVLGPGEIYEINKGLARGIPPEVTAQQQGIDLPTPEEEEELRAVIRPVEEYAEQIIQNNFAAAAKVGMVLLWEQPNAQGDTREKHRDDLTYVPSKSAVDKLMAKAKPPPGYKIPL